MTHEIDKPPLYKTGEEIQKLDGYIRVVTCRSFRAAYEIKSQIQRNMSEAGQREDRDLSISIGIAEYQDQMTIVQFLDLADQNLYLEKNHS